MINVLIKQESSGKVSAMVLGLPEYRVESTDCISALASLQKLLATNLENVEIVSLEIEQSQPTHSWSKFAGMFKDDPYFDEMQKDINEFRQQKNADLDVDNEQSDNKKK